ncbi:Mss4-like protein [Amylocarpus encephaloides]|uniref:Mss4-like protein n=1 Tax=Amylocarpus encephaloides TaxID=45428 RepID=A0A9P7YMP2_9HELO|nr:Mss4-like protein [Amylocarpus encephaloides]
MSKEQGKCHCGKVEWEVTLNEKKHILCHCDTCKILSGGTYTLNQIVPMDQIKITKGSLKDYTYYGDSAYHHQEIMGDNIVVRTGLLNSAKSMQPGAEIYGKARLPWVVEVAQTFDTMPPS